jgi:hypothetical protein
MGEVLATARRKGTTTSRSGHATGTEAGETFLIVTRQRGDTWVDLGFWVGAGEGAGEGYRTLMTRLEDRWCSSGV